jgi:hypothetical protein
MLRNNRKAQIQRVGIALVALLLGSFVGCRVELVPSARLPHGEVSFPATGTLVRFDVTTVRHGAAAASLVPPWPVALAGYGGVHRRIWPPDPARLGHSGTWQATHTDVDVPPRIKVFLWQGKSLSGAEETFLLVNVDVVAVSPDFVQSLLIKSREVLALPNLSWHQIAVVASHTHSGPAGLSSDPLFQVFAGDSFSPQFQNFVLDAFSVSLAKARDELGALSDFSLSEKDVDGVSTDRLDFLARDKRNALFSARTANTSSCLNIFSMHPTFHAQKDLTLSADLAGGIERALEASKPHDVCAFFPGAVGNASPGVSAGESILSFGERFAGLIADQPRVETGLTRFDFGGVPVPLSGVGLHFKGCDAAWVSPFVSLPMLKERSSMTWVSWLRFGNVGLVLLPGEPLSDIAADARRVVMAAVPELREVYVVGLANDYQGYFMQEEVYQKPSLESCSALVPPSMAESFVRTLLTQLSREL